MTDRKYQSFMDWYTKNIKNFSLLDDAKKVYLNEFGLTNKVKIFVNEYLSPVDKNRLLNSIEKLNKGNKKFSPIPNGLNGISSLIYDLRSNFIHNSKYIPFFNAEADISFASFNGLSYSFALKFPELVSIFERGIFNYFQKQVSN
jgi:hypothetical protein